MAISRAVRIVVMTVALVGAAVLCQVGQAWPTANVANAQDSNWTEFAPKLKSNSEIAVAQLDNLVFVIGGYPSTRVYEDTVEIYDARTDNWQFGPPLPQPMHPLLARMCGQAASHHLPTVPR